MNTLSMNTKNKTLYLRAYKVAHKYQLIFRYNHLLNGLNVKYRTHCIVFTTKPVVKNVIAKHTCTKRERFKYDKIENGSIFNITFSYLIAE